MTYCSFCGAEDDCKFRFGITFDKGYDVCAYCFNTHMDKNPSELKQLAKKSHD